MSSHIIIRSVTKYKDTMLKKVKLPFYNKLVIHLDLDIMVINIKL